MGTFKPIATGGGNRRLARSRHRLGQTPLLISLELSWLVQRAPRRAGASGSAGAGSNSGAAYLPGMSATRQSIRGRRHWNVPDGRRNRSGPVSG